MILFLLIKNFSLRKCQISVTSSGYVMYLRATATRPYQPLPRAPSRTLFCRTSTDSGWVRCPRVRRSPERNSTRRERECHNKNTCYPRKVRKSNIPYSHSRTDLSYGAEWCLRLHHGYDCDCVLGFASKWGKWQERRRRRWGRGGSPVFGLCPALILDIVYPTWLRQFFIWNSKMFRTISSWSFQLWELKVHTCLKNKTCFHV